MRKAIVQKDSKGCGIACVACILGISYEEALHLLGGSKNQASTKGFLCKDLVYALKKRKVIYYHHYVNAKKKRFIYQDGTIVFIQRSKRYPVGHYLCRYKKYWMDPWINGNSNSDINYAKAGFRKRLPGKAIYMIQKTS